MTPTLRATPDKVMELDKFSDSTKLKYVVARNTPSRTILPFWGLINSNVFRNLQKKVDVTLMAIPTSIPYLAYLPLKNKPLIAYVAGDEEEVVKASARSPLLKTGYLKLAKPAEKRLLKKSDAVICPNSSLKEKLIDKYHLLESRTYVIAPPGVKVDVFRPWNLKQKTEIKNRLKVGNNLVIGFVAQAISVAKGGDIMIKVFQEIRKNIGNVKLLLIGEDRIGIPNDDSIIHYRAIKREEMPAYYNAMDVFVCPSRSDTGPKVVMEASACSVPVISTDVGVAVDLARKGEGAFIVEKEDLDGMINCCRLLLEDEQMRTKMGRKAREYAAKHFDSAELVRKTAEAIKSVL